MISEVFDFTMVREYDDVVAEATEEQKGSTYGQGSMAICVEKNYQLSEDNPGRKFKGRGVLLGNQVKNQHWEAAFFQDLGNSPGFLRKPHDGQIFTDVLPGHSVKLADAIQAYIQAKLKGPLCWVELPTDAWPPEIQYWKFRQPCCKTSTKPCMDTLIQARCGNNIVTRKFKKLVLSPLERNGLLCIFMMSSNCCW